MIQLITIENPFEPQKHKVEEVYCNGGAVTAYVDCEHYDVVLNGAVVEHPETTIPQDGEQLIVMPHVGGKGIKRILGFAAMIALSLYAGNIAGGLWKGALGKAFAAHTVGALLASGAVMFIGGKIINAIFPQQNPSYSFNEQETSQSYGWDLPTPTQIAGGIVGETYGECIPAAQLLEQHVETINDEQYLNLLYCGGYGPIDSISDVRIDYTSIDNFTGVQMETRLGTNDQKPIPFFKNTPLDQSVGIEVPDSTPVIRTSDSTKATALEVTLEWPGGLFYINDSNNYANATVRVKLEYRKTGTTAWNNFNKSDAGYVYSVTAGTSAAVRKSFLVDGLEAGQYDVRVTNVDRPKTTRYQSMYQWTILTSYLDGVYARPGKVLVALRIKATNQLSGGVPSLNWRQKREHVWVWNPESKAYEQRDADNPIWAAYDILHGCKKLKNINTGKYEFVASGVPKEALSVYFDEWTEAAEYADEEITNPDGEKEPRYRFDAFFDSAQKRITAAQKAATIGHAAIIPHGRNYGIVVDKPGTISQIFGEGRTTVSSVKGSFTSKEDRARAIEVTYNDTQNDFTNTVLTVRSPNYNKDEGTDNTTQLSLFGVKRRSQAYREAITALATNERQLQFVELSADIDAIVAEYGDIVGYSHAASRIGIASGRLESATTTTLTLDKEVTLESGKSYEIYVQRANDTLLKIPIAASDYTGKELTMTYALDEGAVPSQYDNYAFGEVGKAVKPFRIVSASRDGDMLVSLKLAEYDEAMYATELDYSKYPAIDYTTRPRLDEVDTVTATEQTINQTYTGISNILVSWTMKGNGTEPDSYRVFLKSENSSYSDIKNVRELSCVFSNVNPGETYDITVYGVFDAVLYGAKTTTIHIKGSEIAAQEASAFHAVISAGGFTLLWDLAKDGKVYGYRVSAEGEVIGDNITANQFYWPCRKSGTYHFTLVQLDADGNVYGNPLTTTAKLELPSAVLNLFSSHTYRRYQDGQTGYDVHVTYSIPKDAITAEVYYKTNNTDMTQVDAIPEGVAGDEIGFAAEWKYAGDGEKEVIIPGAKIGDKYRIRVMSKNAIGLLCSDEDAQYVDEEVKAKTETPNKPQNLTKDFSEVGFILSWSDVTNTDIDFYEVRDNKNVGAALGLLARVTGTSAALQLTHRKDTLYVYAHNTNGQYGLPASISYDYPLLAAPKSINVIKAPRAATIVVADKPVEAVGTRIYIKGTSFDTHIDLTDTSQYTLATVPGIYDASACYYDLFGEGEMSATVTVTIEAYFDPNWLEDGSVSLAKVDDVVKQAVADAQQSVTDIAELKKTDTQIQSTVTDTKKELTSQITQNADNITSIVTNLNKDPKESGYSALTQMEDAINLRVEKGDVINQINLTPEGTTIDGKYLHVTGTTQFDDNVIVEGMISAGAVSADKIAAGAISSDKLSTTLIELTNSQGFKGGGAVLNTDGLTVTAADGSYVTHGSNGMQFHDANGNTFSVVGALLMGRVADGKYVKFSNEWTTVPNVILTPIDVQMHVADYSTSDLFLDCMASEISKKGFKANCKTVLKSGASGTVDIGIKKTKADLGDATWTSNKKTIQVPEFCTSFAVKVKMNASVTNTGVRNSVSRQNLEAIITLWVNDEIKVNEKFLHAPCPDVYNRTKTSNVEKEYTVGCSGNDSISCQITVIGDRAYVSEYTLDVSKGTYSTGSDTVVASGSAFFIATNNNDASYEIADSLD